MLPKFVVIQSARASEAAVNPRGPIVLTFAFLLGWHGQQDAAEQIQ